MAQQNKDLIQRREPVGEGGFGVVSIGSYGEWKEVGIKDIKGKLSNEALTEVNILKKLIHPNIVRYIDIIRTRTVTSIIMEFIDGGSLYDYIERTAQSKAYWTTTRRIMIDVAHGMAYLHNERIVHADLKSLNVLLRHSYDAVICDFGLARVVADSQPAVTSAVSGTERWFAPELCLNPPERSSFPSDIWAYGCILLEIISKKIPWVEVYPYTQVLLNALANADNVIIFENICLKQRAPEKLRTILCNCCNWKKTDRPNFPSIIRDLTAISESDLENINQGQEKSVPSNASNGRSSTAKKRSSAKPSSLPANINHQEFKAAAAAMNNLHISDPNPRRKPSTKCPTDDDVGKQVTNEETEKYDPVHKRTLFRGPRGGWYYLGPTGKKMYFHTDTA